VLGALHLLKDNQE